MEYWAGLEWTCFETTWETFGLLKGMACYISCYSGHLLATVDRTSLALTRGRQQRAPSTSYLILLRLIEYTFVSDTSDASMEEVGSAFAKRRLSVRSSLPYTTCCIIAYAYEGLH